MQNKKKTKYTLNVDDSRKSNTKNRTKVNKRIIIVSVIVVIAALLILKMYFLDELKDDKKISSGIEKITGDSDNKAKDDNSKHKKANKNTSNDKSKIKKINWKDFSQDTKAILEIPDMLEYPVVQSDDNSFYLHRGLDKKYKYITYNILHGIHACNSWSRISKRICYTTSCRYHMWCIFISMYNRYTLVYNQKSNT